jgi:hypothetical protein
VVGAADAAGAAMTTEPRPATPTSRARVRKPAPGWVFGGALGTFFAALALLAVQVRAGDDPALGEAQPVAAAPASRPAKVVVKRKVIKRIVVHHPAPEAAPSAPVAAPDTSAPATAAAPSAPAPAAPATAPAPAPLTTQSS